LDEKIAEIEKTNIKNSTDADLNVLSGILAKIADVTEANTTQRVKVVDLFDRILSINESVFQANGRKKSDE
jgi:hypothetical protein